VRLVVRRPARGNLPEVKADAPTPAPVVTARVCSLCGIDWKRHGKSPTTEKCIELLLAEVRSLNAQLAHRPIMRPLPYPVPTPYPVPWRPAPWREPWVYSTTWSTTTGDTSGLPSLGTAQPRAIAPRASC
jgi:hypothetical protein